MLLAGVMMIVYGTASLAAGGTAAHGRLREHSTAYGVAVVVGGVVVIGAALVWLAV